jgi:hypothetical protein
MNYAPLQPPRHNAAVRFAGDRVLMIVGTYMNPGSIAVEGDGSRV